MVCLDCKDGCINSENISEASENIRIHLENLDPKKVTETKLDDII